MNGPNKQTKKKTNGWKSLYEGRTFNVDVYLPKDYPDNPPHCLFKKPIFHPNIMQPSGFVRYCVSWPSSLMFIWIVQVVHPYLTWPDWQIMMSVKYLLMMLQNFLTKFTHKKGFRANMGAYLMSK